MGKQDRQGVRTPADIERKYDLGKLKSYAATLTEIESRLSSIDDSLLALKDQSGGASLLDYTVTFLVEETPYEISSVKTGNSVSAPGTNPTSDSGIFAGWQDADGNTISFPYTPTGDNELKAVFVKSYADQLYTHFGVDKTECPYVVIHYYNSAYVRVYFCDDLKTGYIYPLYYVNSDTSIPFTDYFTDHTDYGKIVNAVTTLYTADKCVAYTTRTQTSSSAYYWSNNADWAPTSAGYYYFE